MPCRTRRPLDLLVGMHYQVLCLPPAARSIAEPRETSFVVVEDLAYRCSEDGRYTLYVMAKRGVDTLTALRALERELGLPRGSAVAAGLKDADATAVQHVAVATAEAPDVVRLRLRSGFAVARRLCRLRSPPAPASIRGNAFTIVVDGADEAALARAVEELRGRLLPAYYGYQRFGTIRPLTHVLGYARALGEHPTFLRALLDQAFPGESPEVAAWRIDKRAGRPRSYEAEAWRRLRRGLGSAIDYVSELLRGLDLEALQALAFNLYLSRRLGEGHPLDRPVEGERMGREGLPVAPVPGRGLAPGKAARRLYEEALSEIGITVELLLRLPVRGFWRPVAFRAEGLGYAPLGGRRAALRFRLPRATYATVVLRELLEVPY